MVSILRIFIIETTSRIKDKTKVSAANVRAVERYFHSYNYESSVVIKNCKRV